MMQSLKMLMLTLAGNTQWTGEAPKAGALGPVLKCAGHAELLHAIRAVYARNEYSSTGLTKLLLRQGNPDKTEASNPHLVRSGPGPFRIMAGFNRPSTDLAKLLLQDGALAFSIKIFRQL